MKGPYLERYTRYYYNRITRVTNSQQVLPNISQLRNAVLPTSDDHLRHLDVIVQNRNTNPNPNPNHNLEMAEMII